MTPRAERLLRLNSHTSPLSLHRGVSAYCCLNNPSLLPKPRPGFAWEWVGQRVRMLSPGWPCRRDEFVERYAGKLVGFETLQ